MKGQPRWPQCSSCEPGTWAWKIMWYTFKGFPVEKQANVAKESLAYRKYSLEVVAKAMLNPLSCKGTENPEQSFLLASPVW